MLHQLVTLVLHASLLLALGIGMDARWTVLAAPSPELEQAWRQASGAGLVDPLVGQPGPG